jgi:hypothetical protein
VPSEIWRHNGLVWLNKLLRNTALQKNSDWLADPEEGALTSPFLLVSLATSRLI